jgi:L-aminopeptidase/D-esterase-like protein
VVRYTWDVLADTAINSIYPATIEEAIINALSAAETTTGHPGRVAHGLPLDEFARYQRTA